MQPTSGIFLVSTAIDAPLSHLRWRTILPSAVPRVTALHDVVHDMTQPLQRSPWPTNLEPCHPGRTTAIIQPPVAVGEPKTVMLHDAVGTLRFVYAPNQSGAQDAHSRTTESTYDNRPSATVPVQ